ncbi:MAG TPA: aminoglycoside phosphotransferase family protein [Pyrinomonadaceae bacterium]|nr:aminoglycoside phosphotransferase family protein [Pyrinomonadaceae bacterium]
MKLPKTEDFKANFLSDLWIEAAQAVCRKHNISFNNLQRNEQGESVVFMVDDKFVIKIYVPTKNLLEREKNALELARTSLKTPEVTAFGEIEGYKYLVTTQLKGDLMTREIWLKLPKNEQVSILAQLAEGLKELHASDTEAVNFDWLKFIERQAATCFERQKKCQVNDRVLAQIPAYLDENLKLLPVDFETVFLHGDVHFGNLRLLKNNGKWEISGLFDFADSLKGFQEYDFLAVGLLMIQGQGDLQREFFRAYGYAENEINEELRKRLMILTMFYEWSDLRRYAIRLRPEAVDYSLIELEQAIWNF